MNTLVVYKPAPDAWGRWKVCRDAHYSAKVKDCAPDTFHTIQEAKAYRDKMQLLSPDKLSLVRLDV